MQKLRVKAQTAPVSTTHYIWDSFGHIIAEHTSAGGVQKEYIWLGDTPLAVFEGASLYYVHPDNLDRPVMMTNNNATQTIAWAARYDKFSAPPLSGKPLAGTRGNPVTITSAITNNQRLPGQYFQIEDGLAYNWHRTYDPSVGRYTQADPLGFVDGPSVYGYSGSSPLMRVDPRGQFMSFLRGRPTLDNCGQAPEFNPPLIKLLPYPKNEPLVSLINNQSENREFKWAVRRIGKLIGRPLSDDQKQQLHWEITKQGYGKNEIVDIGMDMFGG